MTTTFLRVNIPLDEATARRVRAAADVCGLTQAEYAVEVLAAAARRDVLPGTLLAYTPPVTPDRMPRGEDLAKQLSAGEHAGPADLSSPEPAALPPTS